MMKNDNSLLVKFFNIVKEELLKNKKIKLKEIYDLLDIDIAKDSIIPLDTDDEFQLENQLKAYFDNQYFSLFINLYELPGIKNKYKYMLLLIDHFIKTDSKALTIHNEELKNSSSTLKILFVCLLSIGLIRALFNEYFIIYASSIIGYISLALISIIGMISFKKETKVTYYA